MVSSEDAGFSSGNPDSPAAREEVAAPALAARPSFRSVRRFTFLFIHFTHDS
jgi:hypothetical protein